MLEVRYRWENCVNKGTNKHIKEFEITEGLGITIIKIEINDIIKVIKSIVAGLL